jgi:flagellar hook-associated protein FlgK
MLHSLNIGLSAIRASKVGLDVAGHNIANANTPGYRRQIAHFAERQPINLYGLELGTGVDVTHISRVQSAILDQAGFQNASDLEQVTAQLDTARGLESLFALGPGSLSDQLDKFFNQLESLSANPHDKTARATVIQSAEQLTSALNRASDNLSSMSQNLSDDLITRVDRINELTAEIADLNDQVAVAKRQGTDANELLGRRDVVVGELAGYMEVRVDYAQDIVVAGGGHLLIGQDTVPELEAVQTEEGWQINVKDSTEPLDLGQGSVVGVLESINTTLSEYRSRIDEISQALIIGLDAQHAQGVGLDGPFHSLYGARTLGDGNTLFSQLETTLPITKGTLTINLVDQVSGDRSLHQIEIDPAFDSLQTVADKISAISNLHAVVDSDAGALSLSAESGYRFDFTGLPATHPDKSNFAGTANPVIGGVYADSTNDSLSFTFNRAGQVGTTEDLRLEVRNSNGTIVETIDVGLGYAPDTPIELANGLTVQLSVGTVEANDSFQVEAVANADETGFLVALGLNSFFHGDNANTIAVAPQLLQSADHLATSLSGAPGDSTNLTAMIELRELPIAAFGAFTTEQLVQQLTADIGSDVQALELVEESLDSVKQNLEAQQAALTGVDTDEEVVRMLQFQRSYEAAARYLTSVNEMTQELLAIIG